MYELSKRQQKRVNYLRQTQGKKAANLAAQKFASKAQQAPQPTPQPQAQPTPQPIATPQPQPTLNVNDPQAITKAQTQANATNIQQSAPNITNHLGGRDVSVNPETGQTSIKNTLSDSQQGLYDQAVTHQTNVNNLANQYSSRVADQSNFDPNKNNPFKMEGFQEIQNNLYQNTMETFLADQRKAFEVEKNAILQNLVDTGNPVGSPAYNKALEDLGTRFDTARQNAMTQAYASSVQQAQAAMQNQLAGQQQYFNQAQTQYNMPFDRYTQLMNNAGQYQAPDFGQAQQFNTQALDMGQLAGQYINRDTAREANAINQSQFDQSHALKVEQLQAEIQNMAQKLELEGKSLNQSKELQEKQMALQKEIAYLNASKAGAGSIGVGGQIQILQEKARLDKEAMDHQAGLDLAARIANEPEKPSTGDKIVSAASSFAGGAVNGALSKKANGMYSMR